MKDTDALSLLFVLSLLVGVQCRISVSKDGTVHFSKGLEIEGDLEFNSASLTDALHTLEQRAFFANEVALMDLPSLKIQELATTDPTKPTSLQIDGVTYVVVATSGNTHNIFKWNGTELESLHDLDSGPSGRFHHFFSGNDHYLVDTPTNNREVTCYFFNRTANAFEVDSSFPSGDEMIVYKWASIQVGDATYLARAASISSSIIKVENGAFSEGTSLPDTRSLTSFQSEGSSYFAFSATDGSPLLYKFSGSWDEVENRNWEFNAYKESDLHSFSSNGVTYFCVTNNAFVVGFARFDSDEDFEEINTYNMFNIGNVVDMDIFPFGKETYAMTTSSEGSLLWKWSSRVEMFYLVSTIPKEFTGVTHLIADGKYYLFLASNDNSQLYKMHV